MIFSNGSSPSHRAVWTLLIADHLNDNHDLRVTLCGAWARRTEAAKYLISMGVISANIEQKPHPQVWSKAERQ
jgi:hypothetical protein